MTDPLGSDRITDGYFLFLDGINAGFSSTSFFSSFYKKKSSGKTVPKPALFLYDDFNFFPKLSKIIPKNYKTSLEAKLGGIFYFS
jgi:hypothetical protein